MTHAPLPDSLPDLSPSIAEQKIALARRLLLLHQIERPDSEDCLRASIEFLDEVGSDPSNELSPIQRFRNLCDDALASYSCTAPSDAEVLSNSATPALVRYLLAALAEVREGRSLHEPGRCSAKKRGDAVTRAQRAIGTALGLAGSRGDKGDWTRHAPMLHRVYWESYAEARREGKDGSDADSHVVDRVAAAYREHTRIKSNLRSPDDHNIVARYRRDARNWLSKQKARGHL